MFADYQKIHQNGKNQVELEGNMFNFLFLFSQRYGQIYLLLALLSNLTCSGKSNKYGLLFSKNLNKIVFAIFGKLNVIQVWLILINLLKQCAQPIKCTKNKQIIWLCSLLPRGRFHNFA